MPLITSAISKWCNENCTVPCKMSFKHSIFLTNVLSGMFNCYHCNVVQVDQDVDVPWPLEVYGHDGKATNVTMEPGTF
jgi:hypothetical protein